MAQDSGGAKWPPTRDLKNKREIIRGTSLIGKCFHVPAGRGGTVVECSGLQTKSWPKTVPEMSINYPISGFKRPTCMRTARRQSSQVKVCHSRY